MNKATPTVTTWPTASAISYGQALSASSLSGGAASVVGSFTFTTPGTTPATGTASQNVTFTPTDTTNYSAVSGTVSVTVSKATPTVTTWPTATAISYGQALSASNLSGGAASVAGSFTFTTPGTTPATGTTSQNVTFTPTDTTNYSAVSGTVNVTVNKATPTVTTWPTATAITYGQTLASSSLSGGSSTPAGSFAFTTPTTAPNAGTANQNVTFTPTDNANYAVVSGSAGVTVNKADSTVSLTSGKNPANVGDNVTFTATVTPTTASGSVIFKDGNTDLGSGVITAGQATFTTSALGAGSHGITAVYGGSGNYNGSASSLLTQVVNSNMSSITITTVPTGRSITVDSVTYTAPQTFSWTQGSSHTISASSPQAGTTGTRYLFGTWSDGGSQSHGVTAPASATTYTVNFITQYQVTTAINPAGSGTVLPTSGSWYAAGSSPTVIATAGTGYAFSAWSGPVTNSSSSATTITPLTGPVTVTATIKPVTVTLNAGVTSKSGTISGTRNWTISLTNSGGGTAAGTQITGISVSAPAAGSCRPTVTSSLPANLGDIAAGSSAATTVTVDFSNCAKLLKFNATISYGANGGVSTGVTSLTGQAQ